MAYYKNFKIVSHYVGVKNAPFDDRNTNQNTIVLTNMDTGKWTTFDFWGSYLYPELETDQDILDAFYYWLCDGMASRQSFDDFCFEFGYDDGRKSKKLFNLCKKNYEKWMKICEMTESETWDFIDELGESIV